MLIGVGATTVNAYLAQESIADRHRRGLFGDVTLKDAIARYKKAVDKGLLKVMSKMGISVISSYRGGYNFEAVGLSRALVAEFFPGMQSRISGIGLAGIARKALDLHAQAWDTDVVTLPVGGQYKLRRRGEAHAFDGTLIHLLQEAVATDSFQHVPPLQRGGAQAAADRAARPARFPHRGGASRSRSTRSRASPRFASAWSRPASRSAR